MRRTVLMLLAVATPAFAQQQQSTPAAANAGVQANRGVWQTSHGFVARAAEQVPESLYSFRPAETVRTLGQLFGHVADAELYFCATALGEAPQNNEYEKKTTKAELVAALKASAAYCDKAYAQSDAAAFGAIKMFGRDANRMFALSLNAAHDYEHYGNIVTYMRIKGLVPPSSQQ